MASKTPSVRALSRYLLRPQASFPSRCQHRIQYKPYSAAAPGARLNGTVEYDTTPILHHTAKSTLANPELPPEIQKGQTKRINLYTAVNEALRHALQTDESVMVFGEDVQFGGVFRCTMNLAGDFGTERVFNTPLSEQGLVGFAIGAAAEGMKPVAEVQFADYVFPAFDQIHNEAAKYRYRSGSTGVNCGGLVIRMPSGSVGHGALYHTQSPEALFTHTPGLRVVIPRSPVQAKGLLLSAIRSQDPVVFMEPKILYRAAVEHVPVDAYHLPLDKAEVLKTGKDVTIVSYGTPLYTCSAAIAAAEKDFGCSVELIDLRTIYPWDRATVLESVKKTGRAIVVHESMMNAGVGAEVAATIQEKAFLRLEAPVKRVTGWATHTGLMFEQFIIPDVTSKCIVFGRCSDHGMPPTSTAPASTGIPTGSPNNNQSSLGSGFVGDEFSNNLFSDLAPLLTLFGEQVTKQFLSMSLGWADNILLAIGPLGIITTIVSAIRIGNVRVLKALIGRAREKLAIAELELLSSTSDETSELWTDGGVVRQPGHAQILELVVYQKEVHSQESTELSDILMRDRNPHAGNGTYMGDLGTLSENDVIEEVDPKVPEFLSPLLKLLDYGLRPPPLKPQDLAQQSPNITLNIHKALVGQRELWLLGVLGMCMQIVALAIPAFMTYYWKEKKGDRPVQNYAYPLYLAGSCVLFIGVALCSHVVEATTVEQTFRLKRPYLVKTIFRLQMACKMGDQNFDSYVLINDTNDRQIRTSRISLSSRASNFQFPLDELQTQAIEDARKRRYNLDLGVTIIMTAIRAQRYPRDISPKIVSLQDPRIVLEHKLSNFTSLANGNTETMGSTITILVKSFFECLVNFNVYGRILDRPHYHWQHLIESDSDPDIAANVAHLYSRLILSFYMNDEIDIIWDGGQGRLDALLRLWDDSEKYNGDSEFPTEGQPLYIHSGTRKDLDSSVESYASWTGKSPRFFERLPITFGRRSQPPPTPGRYTIFGMSLEHVWHESFKAEIMDNVDCLFIVMASSRPEMHALEVLSGFFYAAAERLRSEQDLSDWTEKRILELQRGLSNLSWELLGSGLVKTEEDAKIIVFLPFLRCGLLPSKPPKEDASSDNEEED
ncbi:2-oxoisovalerate dehydrogenase subunit mitochondrial precursor [Stemphylium lycopersici]|nr:2-oxoisovalerate dehydrogenase subunit mitochondrial precursor [Stemphylium lycopersici]